MSSSSVTNSSERFTGRVKWFNNKAGYGFITVTDGPKSGTDVFVHHSSIKVDSEQYKYLVQGEYVDFILSDTKTQEHEYQAGEVCGIKGGKLMCETRRDVRVARTTYRASRPSQKSEEDKPRAVAPPRAVAAPRTRGQGPRDDKSGWTYVDKGGRTSGEKRAYTKGTDTKGTDTKGTDSKRKDQRPKTTA